MRNGIRLVLRSGRLPRLARRRKWCATAVVYDVHHQRANPDVSDLSGTVFISRPVPNGRRRHASRATRALRDIVAHAIVHV
jgi:hypothetical protein